MSTQAPSFPISKLTTGTDRGIANAVDTASVLNFLYNNLEAVTTPVVIPGSRVCYTLRPGLERQSLPSKNANDGQGLICKLDDGHRLNFVITVAPRKNTNGSELKSLHVYFTFPILGAVRVRSTSNLSSDNGEPNPIKFSFGPYLSGSATITIPAITFPVDPKNLPKVNVSYQYTAMGGPEVVGIPVDVPLQELPLPPFSS